jgi:hypothetical protein
MTFDIKAIRKATFSHSSYSILTFSITMHNIKSNTGSAPQGAAVAK